MYDVLLEWELALKAFDVSPDDITGLRNRILDAAVHTMVSAIKTLIMVEELEKMISFGVGYEENEMHQIVTQLNDTVAFIANYVDAHNFGKPEMIRVLGVTAPTGGPVLNGRDVPLLKPLSGVNPEVENGLSIIDTLREGKDQTRNDIYIITDNHDPIRIQWKDDQLVSRPNTGAQYLPITMGFETGTIIRVDYGIHKTYYRIIDNQTMINVTEIIANPDFINLKQKLSNEIVGISYQYDISLTEMLSMMTHTLRDIPPPTTGGGGGGGFPAGLPGDDTTITDPDTPLAGTLGDGATTPGDGATTPGGGAAAPGDGATAPGEGTTTTEDDDTAIADPYVPLAAGPEAPGESMIEDTEIPLAQATPSVLSLMGMIMMILAALALLAFFIIFKVRKKRKEHQVT